MIHPQKDMFNNDAHQAIRNLFIEKRKKLGLSQQELAIQMNFKLSYINEIESTSGNIDFLDMQSFCDALDISLTKLEAIFKPNSLF